MKRKYLFITVAVLLLTLFKVEASQSNRFVAAASSSFLGGTIDVSTPVLSTTAVTDHTATLSVSSDVSGTVYYQLISDVTATEPLSSVVAGSNSYFSVTANVGTTFNIPNLNPETNYKVIAVTKDASTNLSSVSSIVFTTLKDVTAPTIVSFLVAPTAGVAAAQLSITADEAGTAYFLIQDASATAPLAETVLASTNTLSLSANKSSVFNFSNTLTLGNSYTVYALVKDAYANCNTTSIPNASLTVPSLLSPLLTKLTSGYYIDVTNPATTNCTFTLNVTQSSTIYWLIQDISVTAPNAATLISSGTVSTVTTGSNTVNVSGLIENSSNKILYLVAKNATGTSVVYFRAANDGGYGSRPIYKKDDYGTTATNLRMIVTCIKTSMMCWTLSSVSRDVTSDVEMRDLSANNVIAKGKSVYYVGGAALSIDISGLSEKTQYRFCITAVDVNGNMISSYNDYYTDDITPAKILSLMAAPVTNALQATITVTCDETSTYARFLILPASDVTATPSAATVASSGLSTQINGTAYTTPLSLNLLRDTEYILFATTKDAGENIGTVSSVSFRTTKYISPVYSYTKTAKQTGVKLDVKLNEYANFYYLVYDISATTIPDATTIKATGRLATFSIEQTQTFTWSGLLPETNYNIAFYAENTVGNSGTPTSITFHTDLTKPITALAVQRSYLNEESVIFYPKDLGTIYYAVMENSTTNAMPTPTPETVVDGTFTTSTTKGYITLSDTDPYSTVKIMITGLKENTSYRIYAVTIDAADNLSSSTVWADFTTLARTAIETELKVEDVPVNIYPNPAFDKITIDYTLDKAAEVNLEIYSIVGQKVVIIESAKKAAGHYTQGLDVSALTNGTYIIQLRTEQNTINRKLIIRK